MLHGDFSGTKLSHDSGEKLNLAFVERENETFNVHVRSLLAVIWRATSMES